MPDTKTLSLLNQGTREQRHRQFIDFPFRQVFEIGHYMVDRHFAGLKHGPCTKPLSDKGLIKPVRPFVVDVHTEEIHSRL